MGDIACIQHSQEDWIVKQVFIHLSNVTDGPSSTGGKTCLSLSLHCGQMNFDTTVKKKAKDLSMTSTLDPW